MKTLEFLKDMRKDTPVEWQELDEAIAELEALESRSCDDCKHYLSQDGKYPIDPCSECSRFYADKFERKDDARARPHTISH